ncbi:MAG TPA: serine hydrolase domain-containing protein [Bacilli bacterium]|nr:serine hydrolase domain-containing protein [Bacilli bacterium]
MKVELREQAMNQFDGLVDYADEINRLNGGSGSALVVIHRGRIITEHYHGYHSHEAGARPIHADSQFNIASARKSYIGLAVAWAIEEGKIGSLEDAVTKYLPELDRDVMQGTTLRHLLTHTHGVEYDQNGHLYREYAPGQGWAYRGANILMLTDIVRRTTGKTVAQIMEELVFRPLGFTETGWRTEPSEQLVPVILQDKQDTELNLGTNASGDGEQRNLFVSARELAYWGYLHLKQGKIGGKQVVPANLFQMATSVQSPELADKDLPENGFLWYVKGRDTKRSEIGEQVPQGSFQILGVTGPLVLVIPEHELVVVRMCNKRYNYSDERHDYLYYLREFGDKVTACLQKQVL